MAEIIPFGSRMKIGGRIPTGNSAEILRTIGEQARPDQTASFFITYTSPKTGKKIRLDGPFGSHQEAIAAVAEMRKADPRAAEANLDIEGG